MKVQPGSFNSGETMTVGELIEALKGYDPGIAVLARWEGVYAGIRKKNFFTVSPDDTRTELIIDVEDYG